MKAKDIRWDSVLKSKRSVQEIRLMRQVDDLVSDKVDLKYRLDQCQKEIVRLTLKYELWKRWLKEYIKYTLKEMKSQ